ncbi:response regulator [Candidatus Desantisbacteria bacterium]|nr:response regulator [Candidatus Desantisbacteria bacterium]
MPKKVLVADDDIPIVRMIEYKLKDSGMEVICAFDGQEAMEKTLEVLPNLVISDISMPEIDGLELTRRLKTYPETKDIPVIILTSRGEDEQKEEAKGAGVHEFITKPFVPSKLLEIVKRMVGE